MDGLAELMEEPAGGGNRGRRASDHPSLEGRHLPLDADSWQAAEFLRGGGWTIITSGGGERQRSGMTSDAANQHAVLHPDEYVSPEALRELVERELGFTYDQIHSVYRQGRLSDGQRELRTRIDARLLALSRAGANMALLGRTLGFAVKEDSHCRAIENALTRARARAAS
jgi:hypothetical protein